MTLFPWWFFQSQANPVFRVLLLGCFNLHVDNVAMVISSGKPTRSPFDLSLKLDDLAFFLSLFSPNVVKKSKHDIHLVISTRSSNSVSNGISQDHGLVGFKISYQTIISTDSYSIFSACGCTCEFSAPLFVCSEEPMVKCSRTSDRPAVVTFACPIASTSGRALRRPVRPVLTKSSIAMPHSDVPHSAILRLKRKININEFPHVFIHKFPSNRNIFFSP